MKHKRIILAIVAGVLVLSAAIFLGFQSNKPKMEPEAQKPETTQVNRCDVQQSVSAPGLVVDTHEVKVAMPVDGILDQILVRPGDAVKTGDPLATIKQDPVILAKAQVSVAEAQKKLNAKKHAKAKAKKAAGGAAKPEDKKA